jgi:flagellar biosynthesis protein FlhG
MATNLKQLPRVIAVTSGKGGVGKTNIVGNMAVCLSRAGRKVVIIDDLHVRYDRKQPNPKMLPDA